MVPGLASACAPALEPNGLTPGEGTNSERVSSEGRVHRLKPVGLPHQPDEPKAPTSTNSESVSSEGGVLRVKPVGLPHQPDEPKAPTSRVGTRVQDPSPIDRIRSEFLRCLGSTQSATDVAIPEHGPGPDQDLALRAQDLAHYWLSLCLEQSKSNGRVGVDYAEKDAIALRVGQLMREMDLSSRGYVSMEEWVHYMLLTRTGFAGRQINSMLVTALRKNMRVLQDLQIMFEHAAMTKNGALSIHEIMDLYSKKLLHSRARSPTPASEHTAEQFARDIVKAMDLKGDERITYPEFMAHCLGRRKHEVKLHLYDLSAGLAEAVSPWVVGQALEGIWHTGTVVFGKEYYYAKDTVFDEPGGTSFGAPTKVIHLGYTYMRQEEFHEFLVKDLRTRFHRDTYDVICNNCNHFTDKVLMYLIGAHVPEEVMQQPKWLLQSRFVRVVRPVLNWYLRDRVAAREAGKALPPGAPRLSPGDRLEAGTLVCIHPKGAYEHDGDGVLLGRVADLRASECCAEMMAGDNSGSEPLCSLGNPFQSSSLIRATDDDAHSRAGIYVQYFDYVPAAPGVAAGFGQVRTELIHFQRLSVIELTDLASESAYTIAMESLAATGVPGASRGVSSLGGVQLHPNSMASAFTPTSPSMTPRLPQAAEQVEALGVLLSHGFDELSARLALEGMDWSLEKATRQVQHVSSLKKMA